MKKIDLSGQKFNKLTVITEEIKNNHTYVHCICDCGKPKVVEKYHLMQGHITHCGCQRLMREKNKQFTGYGEIAGGWWYDHVVRRALGEKNKSKRVLEVTITIQYAWDLFISQNRKCALSGLELCFPKTGKDYSGTASLDRINSSMGYTTENIQWVHKKVNIMKNKFDQKEFVELCRLIGAGGSCEIS